MINEVTAKRETGSGTQAVTIRGLKKINVLFGKNGTGKSSFLRNLYLSDAETYHLVVSERGGADMKRTSGMQDQEISKDAKKRPRQQDFDPEYRTRAMSRATNLLTSLGYNIAHNKDGKGFNAETVTNLFRVMLPEFRVAFNESAPHDLEIYRDVDGAEKRIGSANQLSSGQKEALSLAADIITQGVLWNGDGKMILVDEPDAHLHVDLEHRFAIFVDQIARDFDIQIVIATHSNTLIANLLNGEEGVGVVCFDSSKETISTVPSGDHAIFSNLLSTELALAVVLGRKVVIVDGNDDFLVWNQAMRCPDFPDVALVQANGGDILKYKKNAEKILAAVLDEQSKKGVTILDGDGKNEYTNSASDVLPCERLKCYSLENLLLTKEVLDSIKEGIDLNNELEKLKDSDVVTEVQKTELDALIADKQRVIISKELTKKIHSHLDQHSSSRDWRIIVGKKLGAKKPEGELAAFLGEGLVTYLWS